MKATISRNSSRVRFPCGLPGKTPSQRAARRKAGLRGQVPPTQIGMRGCWTGRGQQHRLFHLIMLAMKGERLAAPQPGQHLQPLVEHLRSIRAGRLLAKAANSSGGSADADPQDQPPTGELIEA